MWNPLRALIKIRCEETNYCESNLGSRKASCESYENDLSDGSCVRSTPSKCGDEVNSERLEHR